LAAEHGGNRLANQFGPVQRRQFDKPSAAWKMRQEISAHV